MNTSLARANACAQVVPACMGSTIHGVCSKLTWFAIKVLWVFACKYCYCKPNAPGDLKTIAVSTKFLHQSWLWQGWSIPYQHHMRSPCSALRSVLDTGCETLRGSGLLSFSVDLRCLLSMPVSLQLLWRWEACKSSLELCQQLSQIVSQQPFELSQHPSQQLSLAS